MVVRGRVCSLVTMHTYFHEVENSLVGREGGKEGNNCKWW